MHSQLYSLFISCFFSRKQIRLSRVYPRWVFWKLLMPARYASTEHIDRRYMTMQCTTYDETLNGFTPTHHMEMAQLYRLCCVAEVQRIDSNTSKVGQWQTIVQLASQQQQCGTERCRQSLFHLLGQLYGKFMCFFRSVKHFDKSYYMPCIRTSQRTTCLLYLRLHVVHAFLFFLPPRYLTLE